MAARGAAKIFEVRELENDVSFLRNYLTKDLVEELDLYLYELRGRQVGDRREGLGEGPRHHPVAGMTNFGQPYIVVEDGDYNRNRELFLRHCYEGQDLDMDYAERTLRHIHQLWGRTVHLETVLDDKTVVLTFDGDRARTKVGEAAQAS